MLVFCLLTYSSNTNAQTIPGNQLKVSLTRLLWMPEAGLEISYQRKTPDRYSFQFTAGVPMYVFGKPYEHVRGYILGFEPKLFIKTTAGTGKYFSANLRHTVFKFNDIVYGRDASGNSIADSFTIRKNAQSISVRFGKERYLNLFGEVFVLDASIGAGIRYRNITHSGRRFPYPGPREWIDNATGFEETKSFAFILPISFSIGYVF
jgi:hypothetical protein